MRLKSTSAWVAVTALAAGTWLSGAAQAGPTLKKATPVQAGEVALNTDVGHAAPFVYDFDADGKRDLLVGQMGSGHLRIYKNIGTDKAPKFSEDFEIFQAEGEHGTVPTG